MGNRERQKESVDVSPALTDQGRQLARAIYEAIGYVIGPTDEIPYRNAELLGDQIAHNAASGHRGSRFALWVLRAATTVRSQIRALRDEIK